MLHPVNDDYLRSLSDVLARISKMRLPREEAAGIPITLSSHEISWLSNSHRIADEIYMRAHFSGHEAIFTILNNFDRETISERCAVRAKSRWTCRPTWKNRQENSRSDLVLDHSFEQASGEVGNIKRERERERERERAPSKREKSREMRLPAVGAIARRALAFRSRSSLSLSLSVISPSWRFSRRICALPLRGESRGDAVGYKYTASPRNERHAIAMIRGGQLPWLVSGLRADCVTVID